MDVLAQKTIAVIGPCVEFLESLSHIGVNTHFVKYAPLVSDSNWCRCSLHYGIIFVIYISVLQDAKVAELATALGFDETLTKVREDMFFIPMSCQSPLTTMLFIPFQYTLALFLVYPFSAMLYALPNKNVKHLFSFLVGFTMVQWIFGPDWIHSFIVSVGTYAICAFCKPKRQHTYAFWFVMGYMVGAHVYRMYVSYMSNVFDFTGTQMVLTMKLTSFAYNLYDGTADKKNVFPETPHEDKRKAKVYQDRSRFAITQLPSPLAFFGYVYCFTCILAGPAFEFKDYERAVDKSAYRKSGDSAMTVRTPTSNFLQGLHRLLVGVVCLVGFLKLSAYFQISDQLDAEYVRAVGPVVRFAHLMVAIFAYRLKFYFAWKVAEGASVMGGFGFEGYDAEGKEKGWRGVENVDILSFEASSNMQSFTRHWNKRTQGWLERYTYHRSGRSLLATYFISALWHGLYPGFFFMFMFFPVMTNIERLVKAKINPLIVPGYDGYNNSTYPNTTAAKAYWALCVFCTMQSVSYVTQTFSLKSLDACLTGLGAHGFVPHMFFFGLYVLLELLPSPRRPKKDKTV